MSEDPAGVYEPYAWVDNLTDTIKKAAAEREHWQDLFHTVREQRDQNQAIVDAVVDTIARWERDYRPLSNATREFIVQLRMVIREAKSD